MKLATAAVIISFLIGTAVAASASPQRLAEIAREERQRRESRGAVAERVVTSESVRRVNAPVSIGRVGAVVPGAAESAETDAEAVDRTVAVPDESDDPLEALARQRRIVEGLEDEEVRLQLDINRLRAEFQAPVISQRERNAASEAMTRAAADLDARREELAEALELLVVLEEAAAQADPAP